MSTDPKESVVVKGGKRVSANLSEQEAQKEAKRLNAIRESKGQSQQPPCEVKQVLYD